MKVIDRRAADNKYLHRDFHISMNMLMGYIAGEYGDAALTEYLRRFAKAYHSPLKADLVREGLSAVEKYLRGIYEKEEWPVGITYENDVLTVVQEGCPGIFHIKKKGHEPIKQYIETYTTVYEAICEGTPYEYAMEEFELEAGACRQVFRRRRR
jgi:hypothetical protein